MIPLYKVDVIDTSNNRPRSFYSPRRKIKDCKIGTVYQYKMLTKESIYAYKEGHRNPNIKHKIPINITNYYGSECKKISDFENYLNTAYNENFNSNRRGKWEAEYINENEAMLYRKTVDNITVFVDSKTGREDVLDQNGDGSFHLYNCTFYKTVDGAYIFDRDIVRVAPKGLLSLAYGIVYFDLPEMRYKVKFITSTVTKDWQPTVNLSDFQWEVIGAFYEDAELPEEIQEQLPSEDRYTYTECIRHYEKWIEKHAFEFRHVCVHSASANLVDDYSYICKITNNSIDYGFPLAMSTESHGSYESHKSNVSDTSVAIPQIIEENDFIAAVRCNSCAFYRDIKSDRINSIKIENVHRPVRFTIGCIAYEDDKIYSRDNPNLYGYLRYLPEQAKYVIEIPEDLVARDEIFDGYMDCNEWDKWDLVESNKIPVYLDKKLS